MRGSLVKKYRKIAAKKTKKNLEDLAKTLSKENVYWRIVYGLRIIFNYHPEPMKFDVKIKENENIEGK